MASDHQIGAGVDSRPSQGGLILADFVLPRNSPMEIDDHDVHFFAEFDDVVPDFLELLFIGMGQRRRRRAGHL